MSTNDFYGKDMALESKPESTQFQSNTDFKTAEIHRLQKEIFEQDKKNEQNKMKRNIKMLTFFSVIIFIGFIYFDVQEEISDYIGDLIASIFLGGLYFIFNTIIFSGYFQANFIENKYLDSLKKELQDLYNK